MGRRGRGWPPATGGVGVVSGPMAEGGPLPPVDRELLAQHERRIAERRREVEEERTDEVLERLRDGIDEL